MRLVLVCCSLEAEVLGRAWNMAFAELNATAYTVLAALVLLNFIFADLSVTSSWGSVALSSCSYQNAHNSTVAASISIYLQPAWGYCSVANGLQVTPKTDCVLWTNDDFWKSFDSETACQGSASHAAGNTFPGVYAVLCVVCVLSSLNVVATLIPFVRPTVLGQRSAQIVTTAVQLVVFVLMLASLIADTTTPLTDPKNWQVWYQFLPTVTLGVSRPTKCNTGVYSAYIGTAWASLCLVLSLLLGVAAAFSEKIIPSCVDGAGLGGGGKIDPSLTDSLTSGAGPSSSDTIPPSLSVNSGAGRNERLSSAEQFTSPIV